MQRTVIEYNIVVKIPPKKVIPVTFIITSIKKGKFRAINNSSEEIRKEGETKENKK